MTSERQTPQPLWNQPWLAPLPLKHFTLYYTLLLLLLVATVLGSLLANTYFIYLLYLFTYLIFIISIYFCDLLMLLLI